MSKAAIVIKSFFSSNSKLSLNCFCNLFFNDFYWMESFDRALFAGLLQRDRLVCENLVMNRNCWEGLHAFKGTCG